MPSCVCLFGTIQSAGQGPESYGCKVSFRFLPANACLHVTQVRQSLPVPPESAENESESCQLRIQRLPVPPESAENESEGCQLSVKQPRERPIFRIVQNHPSAKPLRNGFRIGLVRSHFGSSGGCGFAAVGAASPQRVQFCRCGAMNARILALQLQAARDEQAVIETVSDSDRQATHDRPKIKKSSKEQISGGLQAHVVDVGSGAMKAGELQAASEQAVIEIVSDSDRQATHENRRTIKKLSKEQISGELQAHVVDVFIGAMKVSDSDRQATHESRRTVKKLSGELQAHVVDVGSDEADSKGSVWLAPPCSTWVWTGKG